MAAPSPRAYQKQKFLLLQYFRPYFDKVDTNQDVEISVRCDLFVFEWLLGYEDPEASRSSVRSAQGIRPPRIPRSYVRNGGVVGRDGVALTLNNCVPIVISSSFLQMKPLVTECLRYIAANILKAIRLEVDLHNFSVSQLDASVEAAPAWPTPRTRNRRSSSSSCRRSWTPRPSRLPGPTSRRWRGPARRPTRLPR